MFLPMTYILLQAEAAGMSPTLVSYLLPILNGVSIFGRIIPGIVADKIGRYNVMVCYPSKPFLDMPLTDILLDHRLLYILPLLLCSLDPRQGHCRHCRFRRHFRLRLRRLHLAWPDPYCSNFRYSPDWHPRWRLTRLPVHWRPYRQSHRWSYCLG